MVEFELDRVTEICLFLHQILETGKYTLNFSVNLGPLHNICYRGRNNLIGPR